MRFPIPPSFIIMKYLVTGGAGFIASHLADALLQEGHQVAVIDNLSTGKKENVNKKAVFYQADILDAGICDIFKKEKPDVVFHYAAQIDVRKSVNEPVESAKTNILGSVNILENCKNFRVKKVVFASSGGAVYGDASVIPTPEDYPAKPVSPYGIEKLTVEHYLDFYKKEYGLDYLILRLANVYGPRQNSKGEAGVIAIFCAKLIGRGQPIINGDGKQTRDFVFVKDVVRASVLGMQKNKSGVFNIGTGVQTNINDIFRKLKGLFNVEIKEIHAPQKQGEQKRSCLDIAKAKTELEWEPECDLNKGLKETGEWFKHHGF